MVLGPVNVILLRGLLANLVVVVDVVVTHVIYFVVDAVADPVFVADEVMGPDTVVL